MPRRARLSAAWPTSRERTAETRAPTHRGGAGDPGNAAPQAGWTHCDGFERRIVDHVNAQEIKKAEEMLGHTFAEPGLLVRALTHASVADSRLESNERMEFLGDAVLGLVVCEHLFRRFPDLLEGEMTKIKSSVVSRPTCAEVARELGMDVLLRLGKGMSNRKVLPSSVLSAVFESLIGALFLDGGLEVARRFILAGLAQRIEQAASSGHQYNFKSALQQAVQQALDQTPQYLVLDEQGPDHAKCFEICVEIGARRFGSSWGPSKKQAEQQAALTALLELGYAERSETGEVRLCGLEASATELSAPYGADDEDDAPAAD